MGFVNYSPVREKELKTNCNQYSNKHAGIAGNADGSRLPA
jgi:hypothetical protein